MNWRFACLMLVVGIAWAGAGWIDTQIPDCRVEWNESATLKAHWSGACRDGKVEGKGLLRLSGGTLLEGLFRRGRPFDAQGQAVLTNEDGTQEVKHIVFREDVWRISPFVDDAELARMSTELLVGNWEWRQRSLITSRGINTARGSPGGATSNDADEIVFDRNRGALYAIYGRALRDNPKLAGKLVVEIVIGTGGEVTDCRLVRSELGDAEVEKKIVARIRLLRFGARDAPRTLRKVLDFYPAA